MWDVRRPFIPFASFAEHSDDVTGEALLCSVEKFNNTLIPIFNVSRLPVVK